MESNPPGQPIPKGSNHWLKWLILIVVLVIAIAGVIYAITREDGTTNANTTVNQNTNVVVNSNVNEFVNTSIRNIISVNSSYEIILDANWQLPESNVTNDIFTTKNEDRVSLKIILVDENVSKTYPTPALYLEARSFEFPSSYTEVSPKITSTQEYKSAKKVFEYNGGANNLTALVLDVNGTLVLFEVSGPSTENIESMANKLATTIKTKT